MDMQQETVCQDLLFQQETLLIPMMITVQHAIRVEMFCAATSVRECFTCSAMFLSSALFQSKLSRYSLVYWGWDHQLQGVTRTDVVEGYLRVKYFHMPLKQLLISSWCFIAINHLFTL